MIQFGEYGILYQLADGDIMKMEATTKLTVREVITFLYYKKELRAYGRRYQEITKPKPK